MHLVLKTSSSRRHPFWPVFSCRRVSCRYGHSQHVRKKELTLHSRIRMYIRYIRMYVRMIFFVCQLNPTRIQLWSQFFTRHTQNFVRTYVCMYVCAANTQHTTHQGTHYTSKTSKITKANQGTTRHHSLEIVVLELRLQLTSFGSVGKPSKSVPFRSPPAARYKVLLAVWSTSEALVDQTPLHSLQG